MNPYIQASLYAFIIFVLWVESYQIRITFNTLKSNIANTWGRADWVYPVRRENQSWMRRTVKQTYNS